MTVYLSNFHFLLLQFRECFFTFFFFFVVQFSPFPTGTDVNPGFLRDKAPLSLQPVIPHTQMSFYLLHPDLEPNPSRPDSASLPRAWLSLPEGAVTQR